MRRVSFQTVLAAAAVLFDGNASPTVKVAAQLNLFLNRRAGEHWGAFPFPELCPVEERTFAPFYNPEEELEAGDVRYWPGSDAYYQALNHDASVLGEPADENGDTNFNEWALLPRESDPDDWDETLEYTEGTQVRHPVTRLIYQARQDMTAGIEPTTENIEIGYWGEVLPFHRVIEFEQEDETAIGEPLKVYDRDPLADPDGKQEIKFEIWQSGILVRGSTNVVWLKFRTRVPSWTGNPYSSATTYALDAQAWDSDSGDYYKSLVANNVGNAVSDTTKWERIDFPYVLRDSVPQAAYADMLRVEGQHDKFILEQVEAKRLLRLEFDKLERQSGQAPRLPVRTR